MEDVSNDKLLPKNKFRDITLYAKDRNKEYEFKSKHLRVYAMKGPGRKIVILGGYKNNQKNDIRKFRATKNEYFKTLKV